MKYLLFLSVFACSCASIQLNPQTGKLEHNASYSERVRRMHVTRPPTLNLVLSDSGDLTLTLEDDAKCGLVGRCPSQAHEQAQSEAVWVIVGAGDQKRFGVVGKVNQRSDYNWASLLPSVLGRGAIQFYVVPFGPVNLTVSGDAAWSVVSGSTDDTIKNLLAKKYPNHPKSKAHELEVWNRPKPTVFSGYVKWPV